MQTLARLYVEVIQVLWIGSWVCSKHGVSIHDVCTTYACVSYAWFCVVFVCACVRARNASVCVEITFSECFCLCL